MAQPFLGEIKMVSFNFAPKGWAFCNGQLLPINQDQALFSLLGTTYGGNGTTTFALPNLQGRVPLHVGQGIVLGQASGEINHTVIISEMPAHTHNLQGNLNPNPATQANPSPNLPGQLTIPIYGGATSLQTAAPASIANTGGSQPHTNLQPYLVINFCIALQGIFPSRN